jgi:RHS repeat-associated protein
MSRHNRVTHPRFTSVAAHAFAAVALLLAGQLHAQGLPSMKVIEGPVVTPSQASNHYTSSVFHSYDLIAQNVRSLQVKELARGLGAAQLAAGQITPDAYAQRVFEYVRQNIRVVFLYGLQKGALGTIIDQAGTPFDQANLMVELLREGGVASAAYQVGTVNLSAAQFQAWTGTTNAAAACKLLADGGFPIATLNGAAISACPTSGALTSVEFSHIWVSIGPPVSKLYDPAYKTHTFGATMDLMTTLQCVSAGNPTCGSLAQTAAMTGATQSTFGGANFVQNVNYTALSNQLDVFKGAFQSALSSLANRDKQLEDVIGGQLIDPATIPTPSGSLPYATMLLTWTGDIPDKYRTRLTVQFDNINRALYVDEIYGQRLRIYGVLTGSANPMTRKVGLYLDYRVIAGSTRTDGTDDNDTLTLSVDHPYAGASGTYADDTSTMITVSNLSSYTVFTPLEIIHGWGYTGPGAATHFGEGQARDTRFMNIIDPTNPLHVIGAGSGLLGAMQGCRATAVAPALAVKTDNVAGNTTAAAAECLGLEQGTYVANYLAQESRVADVISAINTTETQQQHVIGWMSSCAQCGPSINIEPTRSVQSRSDDVTDRRAAISSLAALSSRIEGSIGEQMLGDWDGFSTISVLKRANEKSIRLMELTSSNLATAGLFDHPAAMTSLLQTYVNPPYNFTFVVPQDGTAGPIPINGGDVTLFGSAYHGFNAANDRVSNLVGPYGFKGSASPDSFDPVTDIMRSTQLSDRSMKSRQYYGVELESGGLKLQPPADLVTGGGAVPYSLQFQRTYSSSRSASSLLNGFCVGQEGSPTPICFPSLGVPEFGSSLGQGWKHNFQISASLTNDTMQALGEDSALDAAAAVAAVYTMRQLFKTTPNLATRLTALFTADWWAMTLIDNAVVIQRGPEAATYMRMTGTTFNPPPGSTDVLTKTGSRIGPIAGAQLQFDYSGVSFSLLDRSGSIMNFSPDFRIGSSSGIAYGFGLKTFKPTTWTFPSGPVITFDYDPGQVYDLDCLTGVRNNLGRQLIFTISRVHNFCQITGVRDESNRSIQWGATTTVSGGGTALRNVDGTETTYQYVANTYDTPKLTNAIAKWFTPTNLVTPFIEVQYDSLFRAKRVIDANLNADDYFIGSLSNERLKRGESRDSIGAVRTAYFDRYSRPVQAVDSLGRTMSNEYYGAGEIKKTLYPEGNSTEYKYDLRWNLIETRNKAKPGSARADIVTAATYPTPCLNPNSCNKPSTTIDALNRATSYDYYTNGQIRQIVGPALSAGGNARISYCYAVLGPAGSQFSLLSGKIESVGGGKPSRVASFSYNSSNKYVLSSAVADPPTSLVPAASDTTTCTTASKTGALNFTTAFTFDAIGNVSTINGPRPDSPVADVMTYAFDNMRRLRQVDGPSGTNIKTVYDYYNDGALKTTDRYETASVSRRETRAYWPSGDLFTVTDPENNITRYDYDPVGRMTLVTDPDGRRAATVYDAAGQTLCTWKGWNSTTAPTSCTWDPATYVNAGYQGPLRYAAYAYTLNGKQRLVTDAGGNTTEYVYDNHDYLRYTFFPNASDGTRCSLPAALPGGVETGTPTCTTSGGTIPRYEDLWRTVDGTASGALCSADVQVCRKRDRANQTITLAYDEMGRPQTKAAAGQPTVTYTYNLVSQQLTIASPVSGSIPAHGIQYDYDDAGRRVAERNLINGSYRQVTLGYDEAGNRSSTTWPDNYLVSYQYDAANRMSKVWEGAPTTGFKLAEYTLDGLSRRQSLQFASSSTNQVGYSYEPDSQLDILTHTLSGAQSFNFNYGHNASGQVNSLYASDDFYLPSVANATPYAVDKLNRYTTVAAQNVTYDENGNLLTWFPAAGNKHTYTYDSENRLTSAAINSSTSASTFYDYDALGRRLSKRDDNTNTRTGYLLDGDEEIAEYSIDPATGTWSATPLRRYVIGAGIDDRIAAIDVSTGLRTYYHVNHQGSVLATTNATGDATCAGCQKLAYDTYGQPGVGAATGQPYRYTGRRFDAETGLYYYRARYYAPALGRFLQTDPVGYDADFNLYAYVGNDPVNRNDPSGLAGVPCAGNAQCLAATNLGGPPIPNVSDFVVNFSAGVGDVLLGTVSLTLIDGNEIRTVLMDNPGNVDTGSPEYEAGMASAVVATYGLGRLAAMSEVTAEAGAAKGVTNPSVAKLPVPAVPEGMTTAGFGRNVVGWGKGPQGAASRLESLTADDVAQMQSQGLTREMATEWRAFYANDLERNANNVTAQNRIALLDAILNLMR